MSDKAFKVTLFILVWLLTFLLIGAILGVFN